MPRRPRLPRQRLTDAIRPRQWPYLQALASAVVVIGYLESVLTYVGPSRNLGKIGSYERDLTTHCFWDGVLVATVCGVFLLVMQGLLNTRDVRCTRMMKVFFGVTLAMCALMLVTTTLKILSFLTLAGVDQLSCTYFPREKHHHHRHPSSLGTCYAQCKLGVPSRGGVCCCCSTFSLSGYNVTIFSDVHHGCSDVIGLPNLLLALSMLSSGGLLIACILLLFAQYSLLQGVFGPSLSYVMEYLAHSEPAERSPLLGNNRPGPIITHQANNGSINNTGTAGSCNPSAPPLSSSNLSPSVARTLTWEYRVHLPPTSRAGTSTSAGGNNAVVTTHQSYSRQWSGGAAPGSRHNGATDALTLDLGPPPAYQDGWNRQRSGRSMSPSASRGFA